MRFWNYEKGTLFDQGFVYYNSLIKNYLDVGAHDKQLYVVGPKGIGKSFLLDHKSFKYREQLVPDGFRVYPPNHLSEELGEFAPQLSKKAILQFSETEIWEKIWTYTISIIICRTAGIALPPNIPSNISNATSCRSILAELLTDRSNINRHFKILPRLIGLIGEIQHGVGIFLDSIDQAMRPMLREWHYTDDDPIPKSVEVWTNSQLGLIATSYEINRLNPHLKLFTAIRLEAFKALRSDMRLNYRNYGTFLSYSKEELQKIFILNIERHARQDKNDYVKPREPDPLSRFFGFKEMPHPFAKDDKGGPVLEGAFDFLYRHTLGRPREIVFLGHELYYKLLSTTDYKKKTIAEKVDKVRWLVNDRSQETFETYLNEIIPSFNMPKFKQFLKIVQSNVIPKAFLNDESLDHLKRYYAIGIVGMVEKKSFDENSEILTQVFEPVSKYSYDTKSPLPESRYYLTHPSADYLLKELFGTAFYNRNNIIGNGYDFKDRAQMTRTYDVALSFAGENRVYVEEVAHILRAKKMRVFYDKYREAEAWGKTPAQHIWKIYKHQAKYCVLFISKDYPLKDWTKFELECMQDRAFGQEFEYILPVRFDNTILPGINDFVGFVLAKDHNPESLADLIIQKIKSKDN